MDVVEFGQATPHDHITRWRVVGAVEIATESGDFYDVIGDGCLLIGIARLGFNQFIQQVNFRCVQGDGWRQVRFGSMQHSQPENPPPDDAEDGDQIHQSFRTSQFGFLGLASRFEDLAEHLDFPTHRIPIKLLDGLERFDRQVGN